MYQKSNVKKSISICLVTVFSILFYEVFKYCCILDQYLMSLYIRVTNFYLSKLVLQGTLGIRGVLFPKIITDSKTA